MQRKEALIKLMSSRKAIESDGCKPVSLSRGVGSIHQKINWPKRSHRQQQLQMPCAHPKEWGKALRKIMGPREVIGSG